MVGVCACLTAACSSTPGISSSPRPQQFGQGPIVVRVKSAPPLTTAQKSNLVTAGCESLPGALANAAALVSAVKSGDGAVSIGDLFSEGALYKVVRLGGIVNHGVYGKIASDAHKLDREVTAALQTKNLTGIAPAISRIRIDCAALHRAVTG